MQAIQFFKDLADDTRLKIMLLIFSEKELCVCELTQVLNLSQPKVSRHLAQLRTNGLLTDRRSGKWVFYSLAAQMPQWQKTTLQQCYQANLEHLSPLLTQLQNLGDSTQRQQQCC